LLLLLLLLLRFSRPKGVRLVLLSDREGVKMWDVLATMRGNGAERERSVVPILTSALLYASTIM
jgi:hypothetical protein